MDKLMQIIGCKLKELNCVISYEVDPDNAHIFQIMSKDAVICVAVIYITEHIIIEKKGKETELPTFSISWIKTTNKFGGKGYATMLLIYSICYLKQEYSHIQYAKLDDVSDNSTCRQHNLYNKIGFVFQEKPTMDPNDSEKLHPRGPEKQLLINKQFTRLALHALKL